MIQAVSSEAALRARKMQKARSSGLTQWHTFFIGTRVKDVEEPPQAFLVEMDANGEIRPHFHQVNQFQVFVAGNGSLGRQATQLIALHYADHHTAYGPIQAGPYGLSLFTIRQKSDPGGFYLHMPGYQEMLRPTKKRYLLAQHIPLSTEMVLKDRKVASMDNVLIEADGSDGLAASIVRVGPDATLTGPDPRITGGQYYLVVNGSLKYDSASYPTFSLIHLTPNDGPLEMHSGPSGLEALVLNFPRDN